MMTRLNTRKEMPICHTYRREPMPHVHVLYSGGAYIRQVPWRCHVEDAPYARSAIGRQSKRRMHANDSVFASELRCVRVRENEVRMQAGGMGAKARCVSVPG